MKLIPCKNAEDFLEKIRPTNRLFQDSFSQYVFRGQSNHRWKVIPSALRSGKHIHKLWADGGRARRTNRDYIDCEYEVLLDFLKEIDRSGLDFDGENILDLEMVNLHSINFSNAIGRSEQIWPPKNLHTLISLAQHHGIPTRFVDFSYSSYVASYFAAKNYLDSKFYKERNICIAVYAVNIENLDLTQFSFRETIDHTEVIKRLQNPKVHYQLIRIPSFKNSNLHAQKGLFLAYLQNGFRANDTFKAISLENYLSTRPAYRSQRAAYKFILEGKHALELLDLIRLEGVSASTMFPGYAGSAESVMEIRKVERLRNEVMVREQSRKSNL